MVSAYAVHPDVVNAGDYIFSQSFPGAVQATAAAQFAVGELKANRIAIVAVDLDFGKEAKWLTAIDTPPFYGVRTGAWFLATLDGVRIDTNMHPFREDGSEIEGLYMAGDCSGGFFSTSYPNLFTGLACGRTMVEGRRAGMLAATGQA